MLELLRLVSERNARPVLSGESARLKQISDTHLLVTADAREVSIPFKHLDKVSVCQCNEMTLAPGDRLQLKANGRSVEDRKLVNGELVTSKWFSLTVASPWRMARCLTIIFGSLSVVTPSEQRLTVRSGAGGGTRTRTTFYSPRILSPVRLPFRHTGNLD